MGIFSVSGAHSSTGQCALRAGREITVGVPRGPRFCRGENTGDGASAGEFQKNRSPRGSETVGKRTAQVGREQGKPSVSIGKGPSPDDAFGGHPIRI